MSITPGASRGKVAHTILQPQRGATFPTILLRPVGAESCFAAAPRRLTPAVIDIQPRWGWKSFGMLHVRRQPIHGKLSHALTNHYRCMFRKLRMRLFNKTSVLHPWNSLSAKLTLGPD